MLVHDSDVDAARVSLQLEQEGYAVNSTRVATAGAMRAALDLQVWDVILCDNSLLEFSAPDAFAIVKELDLETPFIVVSETRDEEAAIAIMAAGAHDYLKKTHLARLGPAIERVRKEAQERHARRSAENACRESEELFRSYFELGPIGMAITTPEKGFLQVNDRICSLLGYERDALLQKSWTDLTHPEDLAADEEQFNRMRRSESDNYSLNKRFLKKDGTFISTTISVKCLRNQDGSIKYCLGMMEDITVRELAEETQRASDIRYRALFDYSPDGIIIADPAGIYLDVNRALCRMLGYRPDEMIGLTAADIVVSDQTPRIADALKTIRSDSEYKQEWQFRRRDGSQFPAEVIATFIPDGNILAVVRDISERRSAQDSLRASEERYRHLFESNPYPMWVYDIDTLHFLAVNDAAIRFYGYSEAEFRPMTIKDIRTPDDIPELLERLVDLDKHLDDTSIWRHRKKAGATVEMEVRSHEIVFDGLRSRLILAIDVTERKRTETALRENEIKFRTVAETATDGIITIDQQSEILFLNPSGERLFGYSEEELIGRSLTMLIPERFRKAHLYGLEKFLRTGQRNMSWHAVQLPGLHKDGHEIPLELSMARFDKDGQPYITSIVRDISDRKQAEEQQRQLVAEIEAHRQRINNIVANVPGVVFEHWVGTNLDDKMTDFVSEHVRTMLGYAPEQWLAAPDFWLSIIHPDDREQIARSSAEDFAASRPSRREFRWITSDGRALWVESTSTVVNNEAGEPVGLRGVAIDVSDRKRAELELAESEERYRDLFENARDIIYIHDLQGNYLSVNGAGEAITGYNRSESLRLNITDTVAPEYLEKAQEMVRRKIAGEELTAYDVEVVAKDGHRVALEVNTRLIRANGQPVAIQGIARDITERKQLEDQLRQSQKMEAIGQLAGGIAHDFNNLLTVISGYSDLTLRRLSQVDPLRQMQEEISKAADRASGLTRQLLAFSRKQVLQPKVLDLNVVVADLEKMLQRLIGEDVALRTKLEAGLGHVLADPGQIEQVLMNLAVNARDAMPSGGKLTIETSNVDLHAEYATGDVSIPAGEYIVLSVTDNGCGMDASTRKHIFEPFFTTKPLGEGTGLGLSTAFGIVKQSSGHIELKTEPDAGSTFRIYLPRLENGAQEFRALEAEVPKDPGSEIILLIEDDGMVRGLAVAALEMEGYVVIAADGGPAAIAACERHQGPIHLLVTDMVMPEMNGREAADRVAQMRPGIKVLFMSGYSDNKAFRHDISADEVNFIQKPFSPIALCNKVREILDGE